MQQEHIQWQRKQDQILHMRQQAGGGQRFSRKKAARAGAQRLSPAGRMTWWEKGRKWRCHYSAQWQNDIQEKTIMEPGRTKIQLQADNTGKATSPKYFAKALEFTSEYFLTLLFYQFTLIFKMNAFYNLLWTDLSSLIFTREDLGGNKEESYSPSSQSLEPPPCGWRGHVLWFLSKISLRRGPAVQLAFPLLRDCGSPPEARLSPRGHLARSGDELEVGVLPWPAEQTRWKE